MGNKLDIAICFFGIRRSLDKTYASIERNVIRPAQSFGEVNLLAHFYEKTIISNRRTGENNVQITDAGNFVELDEVEEAKPETRNIMLDFDKLSAYGDAWNDDFASLSNLIHQLHSLKRVTALAQKRRPGIVAFIRPDLNYHDSLYAVFKRASRMRNANRSIVFAPDWQRWGGVNDRFAIAVGAGAIMAYGRRISRAQEFCEMYNQPLHSERLLALALERAAVQVVHIPHRASRVRANGVQSWENFDRFLQTNVQQRIDASLKQSAKPLHRVLTAMNRYSCRLLYGKRYANIDPPKGVVMRSQIEEQDLRIGGGRVKR